MRGREPRDLRTHREWQKKMCQKRRERAVRDIRGKLGERGLIGRKKEVVDSVKAERSSQIRNENVCEI